MYSVRFLQLADHSGGSILEGGRVMCVLPSEICLGDEDCWEFGWVKENE